MSAEQRTAATRERQRVEFHSDLPPGTPVLLLAHELAAALTAGDEKRAHAAACALSEHTSLLLEVLDGEGWPADEARERVGLLRQGAWWERRCR